MPNMGYTEAEKIEEFSEKKELLNDTPEYPYGLRIELRPEDVKKLGLEECEVGEEKEMKIVAMVTNISQDPNFKGAAKKSMSLQITDVDVEGETQDETIYE